MDLQPDAVAQTVKEAERFVIVYSGEKFVFIQNALRFAMEKGAISIEFDAAFGMIPCRFYCEVGTFDDLRSFAFYHGAGEVAPVAADC